MNLKREHLVHLTLEDRLAAAEAKLKQADARVQTLFRKGEFNEMPNAQAD